MTEIGRSELSSCGGLRKNSTPAVDRGSGLTSGLKLLEMEASRRVLSCTASPSLLALHSLINTPFGTRCLLWVHYNYYRDAQVLTGEISRRQVQFRQLLYAQYMAGCGLSRRTLNPSFCSSQTTVSRCCDCQVLKMKEISGPMSSNNTRPGLKTGT